MITRYTAGLTILLLLAGTLSVAAQPKFSKPHGIYNNRFTLKVTKSNSRAEVRFTTDGSEPTAQSPVFPQSTIVQSTVTVRAAEFVNGERTSDIITASYIFPTSVLTQSNTPKGYPDTWGKFTSISGTAPADYEMDPEMTGDSKLSPTIIEGFNTLPILSIVTDKENLFNKTKNEQTGGIYIYTGTSDSNGRGWERPASVELFGGPQEHDLSVNCALKLHGGQGRVPEKNPKHSFRLTFKSEYGPSKLEYPIYGEDRVSEFNSLIVRTFYNFSWIHTDGTQRSRAQYTRDLWARRMQVRMGWPTSDGLYVHLFLNGMYWGLYNLSERIEDNYCKYHFGGKKADYDVIKREDYLEAAEGTLDRWNEMMRLSEHASDQKYYRMLIGEQPVSDGREPEVFVDVDNLIDYMLINQYIGNGDWDHHNWIALRNRQNYLQGFRFICWDSENSFNSVSANVLDTNNKDCPTYLFLNLMKNRVFLHRYIDRAWKHLSAGGLLTQARSQEVWDSLYTVIQTAIYDEAARWGDYRRDVHPYASRGELYTVDNQYQNERKRLLRDFFPKRTAQLISQLKNKGWYATIEPPMFLINGEEDASRDTLTLDDELTLTSSTYFIIYTLDGNEPILWDTSSSGSLSPTTKTFSKENLLSRLQGQEGWVTIKTACKTGNAWSPTIERSFYITGGNGIESVPAMAHSNNAATYDLSGRRIADTDWHHPGIYVRAGKKVLHR